MKNNSPFYVKQDNKITDQQQIIDLKISIKNNVFSKIN